MNSNSTTTQLQYFATAANRYVPYSPSTEPWGVAVASLEPAENILHFSSSADPSSWLAAEPKQSKRTENQPDIENKALGPHHFVFHKRTYSSMSTVDKKKGGARKVRFVVQGFGPFRDSRQNPTTAIATKLVDYLNAKKDAEFQSIAASNPETLVVEVALEAARHEMDKLHEKIRTVVLNESCNNDERPIVILLHLGVNYKGSYFDLERYAYNEADFRIPDERGLQPKNEPIVEEMAVGESLETMFDVPALVEELNRKRSKGGTLAVTSTDPGRFLCNFIYYYSMSRFYSDPKCMQQVRCLFLHVPPNEIASEAEQLSFVADLMVALKQQVQVSGEHKAATPLLRGGQ